MPITLDGTNGLTTPTYNGADTSEYVVPVTAFKNRIINGAMMIDQRNSGASVTPASTNYTLDRWVYFASQASKFTVQQNAGSVTPPAGFKNYMGATVASAVTVGAGDYFQLAQAIEGLNVADLGWGAAGASSVTLGFWIRSSVTGNFGAVLENSGLNRSYPFNYTVNASNTWEYKTVTIPGDTTGTWLTTNGAGIWLRFSLGSGSTLSGTANTWAASDLLQPTGSVSLVATNGATWYITGVQLEKGSTATSFDYRPYGTELALCQRYCYAGDSWQFNAGISGGPTNVWLTTRFPVIMRTGPNVSISSGSIIISDDFAADFTISSPVASGIGSSEHGGRVLVSGASGLTTQRFYSGIGGTAKIIWFAEL